MSTDQTTPVWTEGVCDDGAAILRDGVPVAIKDVLTALNKMSVAHGIKQRYVVRVECPDHRSYSTMLDAVEAAIYRLWDRPPVHLSGRLENVDE